MIYLVIMPEGGIFKVVYDLTRAIAAAEAISGVVCQVPILMDYRKDEP